MMFQNPYNSFPVQQFNPGPYSFPPTPTGFPPTPNMPTGPMPYPQGMPMRSGGFLSRLLGGGGNPGAGVAGGGFNMNNLFGMLQHAQKAMGVYQQVRPMVQQYGPLIRNIPAMYRMLKESPAAQDDSSSTTKQKAKANKKQVRRRRQKPPAKVQKNKSRNSKTRNTPAPKLYV